MGNGETVECSLNSQTMPDTEDVVFNGEEKLHKFRQQVSGSKNHEFLQNSQVLQEAETFVLNYEEITEKNQGLLEASEPGEYSKNSQKKPYVQITKHEDLKEITLPLKPRQLQELQKNDIYCRDIAKKLHKDVEL